MVIIQTLENLSLKMANSSRRAVALQKMVYPFNYICEKWQKNRLYLSTLRLDSSKTFLMGLPRGKVAKKTCKNLFNRRACKFFWAILVLYAIAIVLHFLFTIRIFSSTTT